MKKESNAAALLPIVVFLIFYLGSGIYFEYIHPVEGGMGFYIMSAVVAFMFGLVAVSYTHLERFYKWSGSIPKIGEMFERAVRISPWEGGRMNDISQGVQKAGDGYMVIGDAAALTMPLVHDGLSAVSYTHLDVYKRQILPSCQPLPSS